MKKLKSIGVMSVFRISLVLGGAAGILVGVILMGESFYDRHFAEGLVYLIGGPILYGLMGAIVNAIMAWLYNKVAERLGGIEIDLE